MYKVKEDLIFLFIAVSFISVVIGAIGLMIYCAIFIWPEEEEKRNEACAARHMEIAHYSVSSGKTSTTYYMCRDPKTGALFAVE